MAESRMGDGEACLDLELKRKDGRGESRDIDEGDGTEDDHCTQGIDEQKKSGTRRGSGTRTEDRKRATEEDEGRRGQSQRENREDVHKEASGGEPGNQKEEGRGRGKQQTGLRRTGVTTRKARGTPEGQR